jgi:hypothetical protein
LGLAAGPLRVDAANTLVDTGVDDGVVAVGPPVVAHLALHHRLPAGVEPERDWPALQDLRR